jgi:uncharacterized protein YbbC (DUF1343 family)
VSRYLVLFILFFRFACGVDLGIDQFFQSSVFKTCKDKKIGLIINHTSVDSCLDTTLSLCLKNQLKVVAIFTAEHGLFGHVEAGEKVASHTYQSIPVHSLYGDQRRPTSKMLKDVDILIYDIQDIGVRSYTYVSTLYYVMEEAAKLKKKVIILDRPNPLGGSLVDGMMLNQKWRSFVGYINVPYCHGMTVGELAKFFNQEYQIQADIAVIPMKGWSRKMTFKDTKLSWIPTSPYIPESDTPFFYATTGLIGELGIVSIGIGYTLPFKLIGAPWIDADTFASHLNHQKLPGVKFLPVHYKPFYGQFKGQICHGVSIHILDHHQYKPTTTQMLLLGLLKSLYPNQVEERLKKLGKPARELFCKVIGGEEVLSILEKEKYASWKLIGFQKDEREAFLEKRQKYLLNEYSNY